MLLGIAHPVPAQPDQADPAARRGRRGLRQGPRHPRFPAARRARGAAGRAGLPRNEAAHRAPDRAAHDDARRRLATTCARSSRASSSNSRCSTTARRSRRCVATSTKCSGCSKPISHSPAARRAKQPGLVDVSELLDELAADAEPPGQAGERDFRRPADRAGAAGRVQALSRQSRGERGALRQDDCAFRHARAALAHGPGR